MSDAIDRKAFFEIILVTAKSVVGNFQDHIPTLVGIDVNNTLQVWQFRSMLDKQVVADRCRGIVSKNNLYIAAWVAEAWTTTLGNRNEDLLDRINREGIKEVMDEDQRDEVLLIQIQDTMGEDVYTVPIKTEEGRRFLDVESKRKLSQNPEYNRWNLFPRLN